MEFGKYILLVFILIHYCHGEVPSQVYIGVLLDDPDSKQSSEMALRSAIDYVNNNSHTLPSTKLLYKLSSTSKSSSTFKQIQKVCHQISKKVVAIIGPTTLHGVKATYPVLNALHIPQLTVSAPDPLLSLHPYPYLFKMVSPDNIQSRVLVDLVEHFHWTRFSIITPYEDYDVDGLLREFYSMAVERDWSIVSVERFWPTSNVTALDMTQRLHDIRSKGVRVILLHCHAAHANIILRQAESLGMAGKGWAWIMTNIPSTMPALYSHNVTVPSHLRGLIGFRQSVGHGQLADVLQKYWSNYDNAVPLHSYAYYIFDSVLAVAYALNELFAADGLKWQQPKFTRETCSQSGQQVIPWEPGQFLKEKIETVTGPGTAHDLGFTSSRTPKITQFDIINLQENGVEEVGFWENTKTGIKMNESKIVFMGNTTAVPTDKEIDLTNITLRITTILETPFMMINGSVTNMTSNDRFWGFCKELLDYLQDRMHFSYQLNLVPDGNFGARDPVTGNWSGMVRQLKDRTVDLAMAPFTISYERQQAIDFTKPYLDLGLTMLLGYEKKEENLFRFAEPFSADLWIAIFVSMVSCGVCVSLCSYLSPYGYHGTYIQRVDLSDKTAQATHTMMSLPQAMWFAFASWTHQGAEHSPRCLSGRLMGGIWWLAVTVMIATYTANLAAFLTAARLNSGINSIDDLAAQAEIIYGTVASSQPQSFFEQSDSDPYRRMWSMMQLEESETMVRDSSYGINKVRKGGYAFIWDSAVLEYAASKPPCNIRTVGPVFAKIGYGIGLQYDSPYTEGFTLEILRLRQEGKIEQLNKKYFTGECKSTSSSASASESTINLYDMAGVFYCLFGGFAVGLLCIIGEWCWASYREENMSTCQSFHRRSVLTRKDCASNCICCSDSDSDDEVVVSQRQVQNNEQRELDYGLERQEHPKTLQISIKTPCMM
ncbi:glutamate receptor ionotropic, kainate 2-like [Glandiceps talaboti]